MLSGLIFLSVSSMQGLPSVNRIGDTGLRWDSLDPLNSTAGPAPLRWQNSIGNPAAAPAAIAYPMGRAYE